MVNKKLYYCYDYCNGELSDELETDNKEDAYKFYKHSEDPIIIYGIKIDERRFSNNPHGEDTKNV